MNPTGHHRAARLRYLAAAAGVVTAASTGPIAVTVPGGTLTFPSPGVLDMTLTLLGADQH